MKVKVAYLPYVWIVFFLLVLAGVLVFHKSTDEFAKGVFGGVPIVLEYAVTDEARERGLSGREEVPDRFGMLFVFTEDAKHGFWMKDMLVPIDIFWLNAEREVVSIAKDVSPSSYPQSFYPGALARSVLETRAGFADAYGIATGTTLLLKDISWFSDR
jgi:uncharacterized membrane protein (UPF0127 family)